MPGGVFTHTGIKTAIIIFSKNGKTKEIDFLEINKKCNEIKRIQKIKIEIINKNENYSWFV